MSLSCSQSEDETDSRSIDGANETIPKEDNITYRDCEDDGAGKPLTRLNLSNGHSFFSRVDRSRSKGKQEPQRRVLPF